MTQTFGSEGDRHGELPVSRSSSTHRETAAHVTRLGIGSTPVAAKRLPSRDVLRLQQSAGNRAVQRLLTVQAAAQVAPAAAEPVTAEVPLYWLPDRKSRETFVVTQTATSVAALTSYLYGDLTAANELAKLNGIDPGALLRPGTRLKVAPLGGRNPTAHAARSFRESPWFQVGTSDPAAVLAAMGVSSPAGFVARKRQLDVQLEQDFQIVVAKLKESHYSPGDEERILTILRRWGEEKLTTQLHRYPDGGDYLEQLFARLRRKPTDVGVVTEQVSDYYSLMFNHFDRVDDLIAIRDKYAPNYRHDSGSAEFSLGSFFWEEVNSGTVRDQIFAYFQGVGKGAWSGLKGTLTFGRTLVTEPGKALEQIKGIPARVKALWKNRGALWDQFVSTSPEEQAEIIGKLAGEIEFSLASAAAGGAAVRGVSALGQAPGWLGKVAQVVGAVRSVRGKVVAGIRAAVAGAALPAAASIRAGAQSAMGYLRRLAVRLKPKGLVQVPHDWPPTTVRPLEADLAAARWKTLEYQARRRAAGKTVKGGPIKEIWNVHERTWIARRLDAYPRHTILQQPSFQGVKAPDGKMTSVRKIAGKGRTPDFVEVRGDKVVAGDLKSAEEVMRSVAGGLKKAKGVRGEFRPTSKIGGQRIKEQLILDEARKQGGLVVIRGRDARTGELVILEVDPANFSSELMTYEEVFPN